MMTSKYLDSLSGFLLYGLRTGLTLDPNGDTLYKSLELKNR